MAKLEIQIDTSRAEQNLEKLGSAINVLEQKLKTIGNSSSQINKLAASLGRLKGVSPSIATELRNIAASTSRLDSSKIERFARALNSLATKNFSGLANQISQLASATSRLRAPKSFATLAADLAKVGRSAPAAAKSIAQFATALSRVKAPTGLSSAIKQFKTMATSASQAAKSVRSLQTALGSIRAGGIQSIAGSLKSIGTSAKSAQSGVKSLSSSLKNLKPPTGVASGLQRIPAAATTATSSIRGLAAALERVTGLGRAFAGAFAVGSVVRAGGAVFKYTQTLNGLKSALVGVLGSQEKANKAIAFVKGVARDTKTDVLGMANSYRQLAAAGVSAGFKLERVNKVFRQFAVAGRALNQSNEDLKFSFLALSQMFSKGTVAMQELKQQLGEKLPGALNIMAKALGIPVPALVKLIKEGKLTSDAVFKLGVQVEKTFGRGFKEAVEQGTASVTAFMSQLRLLAGEQFGGNFFAGLKQGVDDLTQALSTPQVKEFAADLGKLAGAAVGGIASALATIAENIDTISAAAKLYIGIKLASKFVSLTRSITKSGGVVGILTRGLVKLVGGARNAAGAIVAFQVASATAGGGVAGLLAGVRAVIAGFIAFTGPVAAVIAVLTALALITGVITFDDIKNAFRAVGRAISKLIPGFDLFGQAADKAAKKSTEAGQTIQRSASFVKRTGEEFERAANQQQKLVDANTKVIESNRQLISSLEQKVQSGQKLTREEKGQLEGARAANEAIAKRNTKIQESIAKNRELAGVINGTVEAEKASVTTLNQIKTIRGDTNESLAKAATKNRELADASQKSSDAIKKTAEEGKKAATALKKTASGMDDFKTASEGLSQTADKTATGLKKVGSAAESIQSGMDVAKTSTNKAKGALEGLDGTAKSLAEKSDNIKTSFDGVSQSLDKAQKSSGKLKEELSGAGQAGKKSGEAITEGLNGIGDGVSGAIKGINRVTQALKKLEEAARKAKDAANSAGSGSGNFGANRKGGIAGSAPQTQTVPYSSFNNAPHLAAGIQSTSALSSSVPGGGIPSILHPGEAVVPLSGGRSIPVNLDLGFEAALTGVQSSFSSDQFDILQSTFRSINRTQAETQGSIAKGTDLNKRGQDDIVNRISDLITTNEKGFSNLSTQITSGSLSSQSSASSSLSSESSSSTEVKSANGTSFSSATELKNAIKDEQVKIQRLRRDIGSPKFERGDIKRVITGGGTGAGGGAGFFGTKLIYDIEETSGYKDRVNAFNDALDDAVRKFGSSPFSDFLERRNKARNSYVGRSFATGSPNASKDVSSNGFNVTLHPNEAVIPLPDGRSVPVNMGNAPAGFSPDQFNELTSVFRAILRAQAETQGSVARNTDILKREFDKVNVLLVTLAGVIDSGISEIVSSLGSISSSGFSSSSSSSSFSSGSGSSTEVKSANGTSFSSPTDLKNAILDELVKVQRLRRDIGSPKFERGDIKRVITGGGTGAGGGAGFFGTKLIYDIEETSGYKGRVNAFNDALDDAVRKFGSAPFSDLLSQRDKARNSYVGKSFAKGTPNISNELKGGGIRTILHPNEAVIPLPDGRSVPVNIGGSAVDKIVKNVVDDLNTQQDSRSGNLTINVTNVNKDKMPSLNDRSLDGGPGNTRSQEPTKKAPRVNDEVDPARFNASGQGGMIINVTINATDVESFSRSQKQVTRELAASIEEAKRFNTVRKIREDPSARNNF